MKGGPVHPEDRWFWPAVIVATLAAIAGGVFFYRSMTGSRSFAALPQAAREELAAVAVVPVETAKVEQTWVEGFGTQDYLIAPVGVLPCEGAEAWLAPESRAAASEALALRGVADRDSRIDQLGAIASGAPGNLLVALVLGTELVNAGRNSEASRVMGTALARTDEDNRIIGNARDPRLQLDFDDANVATVIYLHHALGVAQLQQSGAGAPWVSLKNVIGSVKSLSHRRVLGTIAGDPTWSRLRIPPPGCESAGEGSISSYDLYNNLIVGYMKGEFTGTDAQRRAEFRRDQKAIPSAVHRLLLAQAARARKSGWQNESKLWALSNTEQVLDERRPDDARLAINAVRVIEWWMDPARCPSDVCTDELRNSLAEEKDALLEQAFLRRNVTTAQQRPFAQTATRLLAGSRVDRAKISGAAETMRAWLPAEQAATLADLIAADVARQKLPRAIVALDDDDAGAPEAKLERRGSAWREAAETDFAAAAARWAKTRSPAEQRAVLIATRQLLGARAAPPAVAELESSRSAFDRIRVRLTASKWAWGLLGVLLTAAVWFALMWLIMLIRDWRLLRVSFYNVELEHLRSGEPPPRKGR